LLFEAQVLSVDELARRARLSLSPVLPVLAEILGVSSDG